MAPRRHPAGKLLDRVARPHHLARLRVQTMQMPCCCPQSVNLAAVDRRRAARAIAVVQLAIGHRLLVSPELLTRFCIQAEDALDLARLRLAVHDVDPALADGDSTIAAADCLLPKSCRFLGEGVESFLRPEVVSIRAAPLRPVGSDKGQHGPQKKNQGKRPAHVGMFSCESRRSGLHQGVQARLELFHQRLLVRFADRIASDLQLDKLAQMRRVEGSLGLQRAWRLLLEITNFPQARLR